MIESMDWCLCGHSFHISKEDAMQCLIFRNEEILFEKACLPLFHNWESLFPSMEVLCKQIPTELCHVLERFMEELQNLFWNAGEEIPYDAENIHRTLFAELISSDLYQRVNTYRLQGSQIVEQAQTDLEEKAGTSYIGGNTLHIGYGLQGAVEAGIASAGASLLDYGIGRISSSITAKKYESQLKDLIHGEQTQTEFAEFAAALVEQGCTYAIEDIAKRNGKASILSVTHQDWNKRRPCYASLQTEAKICECLQRLASSPIHVGIYRELMELTQGKDADLIAYGNQVIGSEIGTQIKTEIGKQAYTAALALQEDDLELLETKIAALEDACFVLNQDKNTDQELARLRALQKKQSATKQIRDQWNFLWKKVENTSLEKLTKDTDFCQQNSLPVFVQEMYFVREQYRYLPPKEMAQSFAEHGNCVPTLMHGEIEAVNNNEPVMLWTKWAKKGNPYALLRLGLCRLHGNGVEKDVIRSQQLIRRAAEAGYPPAMYILKQIALGKFKPGFGYSVSADKTKYDLILEMFELPEEAYDRYLNFGRKHT